MKHLTSTMFDVTSDYIYDNINGIFSEYIFESEFKENLSDKIVDRIGGAYLSEDPTVVMVNSYHLSASEIVVGKSQVRACMFKAFVIIIETITSQYLYSFICKCR